MKNSETGAFASQTENHIQEGLTKREYAAIEAMKGLLSNGAHAEHFAGNNPFPVPYLVAENAIQYADELLKQLELTPPIS